MVSDEEDMGAKSSQESNTGNTASTGTHNTNIHNTSSTNNATSSDDLCEVDVIRGLNEDLQKFSEKCNLYYYNHFHYYFWPTKILINHNLVVREEKDISLKLFTHISNLVKVGYDSEKVKATCRFT